MIFIAFRVLTGREPCPPPPPTSLGELGAKTSRRIPALLAPIVILGAMRTGAVTATEAGVLAVVYAIFLGSSIAVSTARECRWAIIGRRA